MTIADQSRPPRPDFPLTDRFAATSGVGFLTGVQAVCRIDGLTAAISPGNHELAVQMAELPDLVRGYEHIKVDNVKKYHAKLAELRTQAATSEEAAEVAGRRFDAHLASNRTCEVALQEATGNAYASFIYRLEECTR